MVVGIIWLWGTMLVAIFYPLIDGGIQQMGEVYRGLRKRKEVAKETRAANDKGDDSTSPSTPSAGSIDDATREEHNDESNQ